jgi:DNA-binding GntR family transcriptional regulator
MIVADIARKRAASLPQMPLERATLPSEIYRRLKLMILDGGLKPGELVTIQSLSRASSERHAGARGLAAADRRAALTVISGRSVGIPQLAADRLQDLTAVRIAPEGTPPPSGRRPASAPAT